ncbi:epidermal retinol dehydrogenase 2-like isoform X2 [Lycorma delicatula]|uniref:epidermal retinol dehydrogenase 2-like isoform X2 n=1 Tax=Lycorma delicatula TaxID=130591 RepID=UPI003F514783
MCDSKQNNDTRQNNTVTMLKFYSVAVLLLDILLLHIKVLFSIFESIYNKFLSPEEKSVAGEIVLITGTGHGIGQELAVQFSRLGATVVCLDINKTSNEETVKKIAERGFTKAHNFQCDVSKRDEVLAVAKDIQEKVGNVTMLINNAGIMPCHPFFSHTELEIKKLFDINVLAHFWMLEAFLPDMIEKNHGHVVALSSMAGVLGLTNLVPYCASKFAVRGFMEALSEELREDPRKIQGVYFTTIYPYIVDTGLCKKPRIRFPTLMGVVSPQEAANQIVTAVRRNYNEASIPGHLLTVNNVFRLFPVKVCRMVKDFLDSGVESHD